MKRYSPVLVGCVSAYAFTIVFAFFRILSFGFHSDDIDLLAITGSDVLPRIFDSIYIRPLWHISYPLTGLISKDAGFQHAVNIFLHVVNATLFIFLYKKSLRIAALIVTFFWTCLPWTMIPIAWISQRNDLLMTAFFLISIHFIKKQYWQLGFWSLLLAAISKTNAIFAPLSLFLTKAKLPRHTALIGMAISTTILLLHGFIVYKNFDVSSLPQNSLTNPVTYTLIPKISIFAANFLKNYLLGNFLLLVPLPFFLSYWQGIIWSILNISALSILFRLKSNLEIPLFIGLNVFLLSTFFGIVPNLRISYLQVLMMLSTIVPLVNTAISPLHLQSLKQMIFSSMLFMYLLVMFPSIQETVSVFDTEHFDLNTVHSPNPLQSVSNPVNNFYDRSRAIQSRLLKYSLDYFR